MHHQKKKTKITTLPFAGKSRFSSKSELPFAGKSRFSSKLLYYPSPENQDSSQNYCITLRRKSKIHLTIMEVQKRKYLHDGEMEVKKQIKTEKIDGNSKMAPLSAAATSAEPVVEDDEVEEFYAILRRIRVAVKYFEKGNAVDGGAGRNLTAAKPWNFGFRRDDFKRNVDGVKERESVEDNAGWDLNADPVTDPN